MLQGLGFREPEASGFRVPLNFRVAGFGVSSCDRGASEEGFTLFWRCLGQKCW